MSLVIGIKTKDAILFISDGLALVEEESNGENRTRKLHTYSKVRVLQPWNILLGFIGSTDVCFEILGPLVYEDEFLESAEGVLHARDEMATETLFLEHLCSQVEDINARESGERVILVAGYYDRNDEARIFLFDKSGKVREINRYVCLGSGAERVSPSLEKKYNPDAEPQEAAALLIDLIFLGSEIPTVNFIPMLSILTLNGVCDYSEVSVTQFEQFKEDLRATLLTMIATLGHQV